MSYRNRLWMAILAAGLSLGFICGARTLAAAEPSGATTLDCGAITSKILARDVSYCVDLPAGYASSGRRYPSLYFLHGLFEHYHAWDENGGKDIYDALLKQDALGPFIVVLPDGGNSFWVNSFDGKERYEDFFIQELVPYIDGKYRTINSPAERGISGVSMGGYGALHLAMKHPDIFGSVSAQGAALIAKFPNPLPTEGRLGFYIRLLDRVFGAPGSPWWNSNNPLTLADDPGKFPNLKIYFDCGTDDRYGFETGAEALDAILNRHDFPHVFALRAGNHGWDYMQKYMADAWLFHWQAFSAAMPQAPAGK